MDRYEIKFFKDGSEIELNEMPDVYINGCIKACNNELKERSSIERLSTIIARGIVNKQK